MIILFFHFTWKQLFSCQSGGLHLEQYYLIHLKGGGFITNNNDDLLYANEYSLYQNLNHTLFQIKTWLNMIEYSSAAFKFEKKKISFQHDGIFKCSLYIPEMYMLQLLFHGHWRRVFLENKFALCLWPIFFLFLKTKTVHTHEFFSLTFPRLHQHFLYLVQVLIAILFFLSIHTQFDPIKYLN